VTHARNTVLDRIVTAIGASPTTATVAKSRIRPTGEADFILVYAFTETALHESPDNIERNLTVVAEIRKRVNSTTASDELEVETEHVEQALNPVGSISGVKSCLLVETRYDIELEPTTPVMVATLVYDVYYRTSLTEVSTIET